MLRQPFAAQLRFGAAVAVGVLVATLLAGCTPLFTACAMPNIRPPHVELDVQGWHRTHSVGTVHACYAGYCDHEDGTTASFEVVIPRKVSSAKKHDLVVTLTDPTGTTSRTVRMALEVVAGQTDGPCPMPDQWSREVLITADGKLQVGGADDGQPIIPTPGATRPVRSPAAPGERRSPDEYEARRGGWRSKAAEISPS
jgi:hypothetical protein